MLLGKIIGVLLHYHRIIALGDRIILNGIEESSHGLLCGAIIEFA
jgi:sporulation protein YlmC with PRC-barrel domain